MKREMEALAIEMLAIDQNKVEKSSSWRDLLTLVRNRIRELKRLYQNP
jgi:hypothetical protein